MDWNISLPRPRLPARGSIILPMKIIVHNFFFEYFPQEIIIEILKILPLKSLTNIAEVDTIFNKIVKKTKWDHIIVSLYEVGKIELVIKHYNFMKYHFNHSYITDASVKELHKCHTLYLGGCNKITDATKLELKKSVNLIY